MGNWIAVIPVRPDTLTQPYNHYQPLVSFKDAWITARVFLSLIKLLKFENMIMFTVGLLCLAVSFLMYAVLKLYEKIEKMEEILKSINHDLNMVSKTMDNQKQILKG